METEYLNDSIQVVLKNLDKLPDKLIDEIYFLVGVEIQERGLAIYTDFDEIE